MPTPPPVADSSLALWLSAESVTPDGDGRVARWNDVILNGPHAEQPIAAARPLLVVDAFGPRPGLRFAGGQSLNLAQIGNAGPDFTIFALGRPGAAREIGGAQTDGQRLLFYQYGATYSAAASLSVGSNGVGLYYFGPASGPQVETTAALPGFCPLVLQQTAADTTLFLDGTPAAAISNLPMGGIEYPRTIGGPNDRRGDGFVGDLAEVLIYTRALTSEERLQVETWLQLRYDCFPESSSSSSAESSGSSEESSASSDLSSSSSEESSSASLESSASSAEPSSSSEESSSSSEESSSSGEEPSWSSTESSSSTGWEDVPDPVPITAGLRLWLRSDRHVTADHTGQVSAWADARGLPLLATQGDAARFPTLLANGLPPQPSVRFAGSHALTFDPALLPATAFTVFLLARPTGQRTTGALGTDGQRFLLHGPDIPFYAAQLSVGQQSLAIYPHGGGLPIYELIRSLPALCPYTARLQPGEVHLFLDGEAIGTFGISTDLHPGYSLGGPPELGIFGWLPRRPCRSPLLRPHPLRPRTPRRRNLPPKPLRLPLLQQQRLQRGILHQQRRKLGLR
jgi:hypothetical protein